MTSLPNGESPEDSFGWRWLVVYAVIVIACIAGCFWFFVKKFGL